jgi:hypothetical protein
MLIQTGINALLQNARNIMAINSVANLKRKLRLQITEADEVYMETKPVKLFGTYYET